MRRITDSEIVFLLIVVVLALPAWIAYQHRVQIEAWWWHRRHGEVVTVADYVVPAPRNWYVAYLTQDNEMMIRLDTDDHSEAPSDGKKMRFQAQITLFTSSVSFTSEKLDSWTSFQSLLLKKNGAEPALRKYSLDCETLSCVGGQRFSQAVRSPQFYESDPAVWTCQSAGRLFLLITATDADMHQVWDIVAHIRKKS